MTIRKLAAAILDVAIRHSAPACRDWGEAMRREMDFVESDWNALWWALVTAACESVSRNPGAADTIQKFAFLGLTFIEFLALLTMLVIMAKW